MTTTSGRSSGAGTSAAAPSLDRSRRLALYVLCTGMLMIVLDVTVVNVALPTIQDDLGFTSAGLAWVVNAYLVAFGGLLLLAGRLGDLLGRRRMFLWGLGVFTVASLLCGVAGTQEVLVVARFLQGVGGALTSAVILGVIVTMFPEPREQAKAIGVYAFVASAGGSAGLLAGGLITQWIDWHWVFVINVPIGLVTGLLGARLLPADTGLGLRAGADVPGAVLITTALMLGVFTIVEPAAQQGWTAPETIGLGAASLVLLVAFVVREATARVPLMPLRIFASSTVVGSNLVQALSASGMFGLFFMSTLYLKQVLGYDAMQIGLAFLPVTLLMGVLSVRYSERLVTRWGARPTLITGLSLITAGLVLFAGVPVDGSYLTNVLPGLLLFGLGGGVAFPALMTLAMSEADEADAGLASGLINTTAEVGAALGLAVLATLAESRTEDLLAGGSSEAVALTDGFRLAFWVAVGLLALAVAVALAVLRPAAAGRHGSGHELPGMTERGTGGQREAGEASHGQTSPPLVH